MKKSLPVMAVLFIAIIMAPRIYGQTDELSRMERLNAQKIAYFTQKLQLTPSEAERFWPVYNQFQKEKNTLVLDQRKSNQFFRQNIGSLSDEEIEALADGIVRSKSAEADLYRDYHEKFKEILPIKKVMVLYQAESSYMAMLLQQLRNNRSDRSRPR